MQLFNIAMLGKTGWRLLSDPDALLSKVLKAKYFPQGNFLSADVGHSPSFTWRSIWSAQDLVRQGVRWRVSHGDNIRVFKDPWLRSDRNFYISSLCPPELRDMKVSDLIIPGTNCWDVELLEEVFNAADVKEITSIPLAPGSNADILIWHFSRNGKYTVKSAYRLACSLTIDDSWAVEGRWKLIWQLHVPPKVKVFLWRAAHNNLPTKAKLLSRGVDVGGECGICRRDYETIWHTFIVCPFAARCWKEGGLEQVLYDASNRSDSFFEVLFLLLSHGDGDVNIRVSMILWQIWKDRNAATWTDVYPVPARSCALALGCRSEWLAAQSLVSRQVRCRTDHIMCKGWHDLPSGWIRCGVDAAFFMEDDATGIGIIIRDHHGKFVAAKVIMYQQRLNVDEGEIMGISEALSWVKMLGYTRCVLESDCKVACDAINNSEENISELGAYADFCRRELAVLPEVKVKHIKRELNGIAHRLARVAKDFVSPHVWNEPPPFVEGLLHFPCSCA